MTNERDLYKKSVLLCRWHTAAVELLYWEGVSQTSSGVAGEAVGAAESETMVLWHKASPSEVLAALRAAAKEILKNGHSVLLSFGILFEKAAKIITMWTEHWTPSEPHQELIPWVGWFRPVAARNWLWEYAWPEEEYLHP